MITSLPTQPSRPTRQPAATASSAAGHDRSAARLSTSDYRLLGLRPREARVEVIRGAVQQAASQVQVEQAARTLEAGDAPGNQSGDDEQLTQIAVAGYRLLDPRRRRTLFERVQLLMCSEEELDTTVKSLWATQASEPTAPPRVRIAINRPRRPTQAGSARPDPGQASNENQVALELFRNIRKRDRRAVALWIGLLSLTASLATALALFATFAN